MGFGSLISMVKWVQALFRWMRGFVPGVQLVLGGFALLVTVVSGVFWFRTHDTMLHTFLAALTYKVAHTPEDYKALEAVVLSVVRDDPETGTPPNTTGMVDYLFTEVIKELKSIDKPKGKNKGKPKDEPLKFIVKDDKSKLANYALRSWRQYVTLDYEALAQTSEQNRQPSPLLNVYLFVPGIVLHKESKAAPISQDGLHSLLQKDPMIMSDINGVLRLAPILPKFDKLKVFEGKELEVVQSYFITQTGVALLREAGTDDQRSHYNLASARFLPERPYFWPTLFARYNQQGKDRKEKENRGFDYRTEPYIDLGNNGPIRSYCWGFVEQDTRHTTDAALCLDVALPDANKRIQEMLEKTLSAKVEELKCTGKECGDDEMLNSYLAEKSAGSNNALEDVYGSIHVLDPGAGDKPLTFTIPIKSKPTKGEKSSTTTLIKASVDLKRIQTVKVLTGSVFGAALIVCFAFAITLFLVYKERKRDSEKLIKNLDEVMAYISDPYVRVDPDDIIQRSNHSFKTMLGRDHVNGSDIHDYLEPLSKNAYDAEKKEREKGNCSTYKLTFKNINDEKHEVLAHGVPLPVPKEFQKRVPDRFGIFTKLPEKPPKDQT